MPTFIVKDRDGDECGTTDARNAAAAVKKIHEEGNLNEDYAPFEAFELVSSGKFETRSSIRVVEVK